MLTYMYFLQNSLKPKVMVKNEHFGAKNLAQTLVSLAEATAVWPGRHPKKGKKLPPGAPLT